MSTITEIESALEKLPVEAQREVAAWLESRLAAQGVDADATPVPASHKRVLKKRLADYKSGASQPISHVELMRRVRST